MGATRRGRELSPAMRREIIGMREGGISFADIGRELHIVRYVRNDRTKRREPLADISADLNLNVHSDTRKRVLKNAGLNHRIA